jgi:hypothetical protein
LGNFERSPCALCLLVSALASAVRQSFEQLRNKVLPEDFLLGANAVLAEFFNTACRFPVTVQLIAQSYVIICQLLDICRPRHRNGDRRLPRSGSSAQTKLADRFWQKSQTSAI